MPPAAPLLRALALLLVGCRGERGDPQQSEPWECPWEEAASNTSLALDLAGAVDGNDGYGAGLLRVGDPDGLLQDEAAGQREAGGDEADPDDAFEVASITKTVTAALVLRLVEEGAVELDAPFAEALPEWGAGLLVIDGEDLTGTITVRQLLAHRSGLPDYWSDPPYVRPGINAFLADFLDDPDRFWEPDELIDAAAGLDPIAEPGLVFHYSDTNYVLLGLLAEALTDEPLHEAMRARVFDPLGMDDTWMSFREEAPRSRPLTHRYEGPWDMTVHEHQSADWAGGGLVSTSHDLRALLCGLSEGGLFEEDATLAEMQGWEETGMAGVLYGLGLFGVELDGGGLLWGHEGYGNAFAYIEEDSHRSFVGTLNQTENDLWDLLVEGL